MNNNLIDSRIKTAIVVAPWGRNFGFFDAESLAGVQILVEDMCGRLSLKSDTNQGATFSVALLLKVASAPCLDAVLSLWVCLLAILLILCMY